MKRILLLSAILFAFSYWASSQKNQKAGENQIDFNGYVIKILPLQSSGYGYSIYQHGVPVIHETKNPFTKSPDGLVKREDAVKVAKWQVVHLNPGNRPIATDPQPLPLEVARQLNITLY